MSRKEEIYIIIGLIITAVACIAAWLVVPAFSEFIENTFGNGAEKQVVLQETKILETEETRIPETEDIKTPETVITITSAATVEPNVVEVTGCSGYENGFVNKISCDLTNNSSKHVKEIEYTIYLYDTDGFPSDRYHKITTDNTLETIHKGNRNEGEINLQPYETATRPVLEHDNLYLHKYYGYMIMVIKKVTFYDQSIWYNPEYQDLVNKFEEMPLINIQEYIQYKLE